MYHLRQEEHVVEAEVIANETISPLEMMPSGVDEFSSGGCDYIMPCFFFVIMMLGS
jgi:hypothetical protein